MNITSGLDCLQVLTEENLDQLDNLYKLISPTRDGEKDYHTSLSQAADHIFCLLEGKERPVVGTTYKELKELLVLIAQCGYFDRAPHSGEEEVGEEQAEKEFEVVLHEDLPAPESEEVQSSLPPEILQEPEVGGVLPQTEFTENEAELDVQGQVRTKMSRDEPSKPVFGVSDKARLKPVS